MKRIIWIYPAKLSTIGLLILFIFITGFRKNDKSDNNYKIAQVLDSSVTDFDGNVYRTIKIGTQVWMAENIKVTHYRDGTPIPNVYNNDKWPLVTIGAYCLVNNDSIEYKDTYGVLYNFYAVDNNC